MLWDLFALCKKYTELESKYLYLKYLQFVNCRNHKRWKQILESRQHNESHDRTRNFKMTKNFLLLSKHKLNGCVWWSAAWSKISWQILLQKCILTLICEACWLVMCANNICGLTVKYSKTWRLKSRAYTNFPGLRTSLFGDNITRGQISRTRATRWCSKKTFRDNFNLPSQEVW